MSKHHYRTTEHKEEDHGFTALAEDAQALVTATADVAGEKVAQARKRLSDGLVSIREQAAERLQCADAAVRENPYKTAGIALGIGVLIGLVISRRSSRKD